MVDAAGDSKTTILRELRLAVREGNDARARELLYHVLCWSLARPREVVESLDVKRLFPIRDEKPCLRLQLRRPRRGEEHQGSHFGGTPLLPKRMKWPAGPNGPLAFIGQLDFAELARIHRTKLPLPVSGVLSLFYDLENPVFGNVPSDLGSWKLVFIPNVADGRFVESEELDPIPLRAIDAALARSPAPAVVHQIGGQAAWVHGDARPELALGLAGLALDDIEGMRNAERRGVDVVRLARQAAEWRLLWQIPSTLDLFDWGDSGTLYVIIRDRDLGARRFEKARCVLQCT